RGRFARCGVTEAPVHAGARHRPRSGQRWDARRCRYAGRAHAAIGITRSEIRGGSPGARRGRQRNHRRTRPGWDLGTGGCTPPPQVADVEEKTLILHQEAAQLLAAARVPELAQRLRLDLADPLTSDIELLADLFQG